MITINYKPNTECFLETEHKQCCCVCVHRRKLMNHPWYTNKPMREFTGIYICSHPEFEDKVTPTGEHSVGCECFERKP